MERIKVFAAGCLLFLPFFMCLISDNFTLIWLGTMYLAIICKFVPKKFWRRFIWVNARISKKIEDLK